MRRRKVARGFIAGKAEGIEDGAASSAAGRPAGERTGQHAELVGGGR
jgi:hypothetical protein